MDCGSQELQSPVTFAYRWNSYFSPEMELIENSLVFSQKRVVSLISILQDLEANAFH
jgi:hypothetical protein